MKTIRYNTFETNSSSTHSLTISTEKEYEDLKNNKLFIYVDDVIDIEGVRKHIAKRYSDRLAEFDTLIHSDNMEELFELLQDCEIYTFSDWKDYREEECEIYSRHFTTPSGDKMVAWGHYGYIG